MEAGKAVIEKKPWYWPLAGGVLFDYEILGDTLEVGSKDFIQFAKSLGEAAIDKTYSEEIEVDREYRRYLENFDYNTKVRPAMLETVENKAITDFGANFVDPFVVTPVAAGALPSRVAALTARGMIKSTAKAGSLAATGVAKVGETTAKLAGLPRKAVAAAAAKVVPKEMRDYAGASAFGGQLVGAMTGAVPGAATLGISEAAGYVAGRVGRNVADVLKVFSDKASNARFLYRLATDPNVAMPMRKMAMWAYKKGGTQIGDAAFNSLVNGVTAGALNAALAGLAGESAGGLGQAAGAGYLFGAAMPFGQPGVKGGKTQVARDTLSIEKHMQNKVVADQRESFKKMDRNAQIMFATLSEGNVGAPKVAIVPKEVYRQGGGSDTQAYFSPTDRTIYVNEGRLKKGSQEAMELMAHEVGHDFVKQALGNDPAMLQILLEEYKTTPEKGEAFYWQYDQEGNPIGDPIHLDERASAIRTDYDRRMRGGEGDTILASRDEVQRKIRELRDYSIFDVSVAEDRARTKEIDRLMDLEGKLFGDYLGLSGKPKRGIGNDASVLAQEVGADQFSMMFSENPNAFDNFHPRLRRHLIDAARRFLTSTAQAEPLTGNPLSNTISKQLQRNPAIARLYKNYGKARSFEIVEKGDTAEAGVLVEPRKGQTGEERFTELFGGVGLSLAEGKNLRITDKRLFEELKAIRDRYENEAPEGWKVTPRTKTGAGGWLEGKKLTDELRTLFTRNDRFGNVANIIDAATEAIAQRIGVRFGYRSGTKSKYQNPFKLRDVGLYGFQISPIRFSGGKDAKRQTRPTLKVVGYDEAKLRHNVDVMVQEGIVKNPKEFFERLAKQGQEALLDPEGRINPDGRKENEDLTVAFGMKGSLENIASPRLKELLEKKKIKDTFVSYDLEAMAGLSKGRDAAFVFDYENVRDNYSHFFHSANKMPLPKPQRPEGDKLYMPAERPLGLRDNIREDVLPSIKQDKLSLGQFKAALGKTAGAKAYAEEIGLLDFLEGKKSVTKGEIDSYVAENAPRLEEKKLSGEESDVSLTEVDRIRSEDTNGGGEVIKIDAEGDWFTITVDEDAGNVYVQGEDGNFLELDAPINRQTEQDGWRAIENHYRDKQGPPTKFSGFQEPGGTNYREVLIKLPVEEGKAVFSDPRHFGDNALLWLRLNDRIDADGKKVLFMEELQSQWHQEGRKKGYAGQKVAAARKWAEGAGIDWDSIPPDQRQAILEGGNFDRSPQGGVPDAPFKKNWPALGLKRVIREALENGYDRVAWLDGEGQAARYDLSKHIDSLEIIPLKDGTDKLAIYADSNLMRHSTPEGLADIVGKEIADKAIKDGVDKDTVIYSGLDLKVGGEGMKAFYDREMVSIANKISKKIGGGKVRKALIPRGRLVMTAKTSPSLKTIPKVHVLDLPKNPQAVENLRLYMPAEKAPSDSTPPELIFEKDPKGQTTLPFAKTPREETEFARLWNEEAERTGTPKVGTGEIPDPPKGWQGGTPRETRGAFDPRSPGRMFMPAAEAGATKGKQAEAAKLWQEKGTDSPYFKKWFGKSKVVDENGEPLVVYHGTTNPRFSEFGDMDSPHVFSSPLSSLGWHYFTTAKPIAEHFGPEPILSKERTSVKIATKDGLKRKDALKTKVKGLVVTSWGDNSYTITHEPSGMAFGHFADRHEITEALHGLKRLKVDFSASQEKLEGLSPATHRKIVNAVRKAKGAAVAAMFGYGDRGISGHIENVYLHMENPVDLTKWTGGRNLSSITVRNHLKALGIEIDPAKYGMAERKLYQFLNNPEFAAEFRRQAKELGFDGVRYNDLVEGKAGAKGLSFIAFSPEQIKSATGNRGTFDVGERDMLYMPAGADAPRAREGDVVRLDGDSLRLFMPASDKVRLEDYADRKMFALASDRLGIGRMYTGPKGKKKELPIEAQGGRGFMQIFNGGGWAFKGKQTADNFIKRVREVADGEDSVIVGITILSDLNHLHSAYGQLAYANALRAAVESGTITEGMANRQIREIVKRIKQAKTKKPLPAESRKVLEGIKNFADFEKAVKAKKINFNLMAKVREKAEGRTLPLKATEAERLELDVPSIARDIADPELVGADFGKVVALLEVPANQTPKKTDFHYSYPYTIEGNKIGFLEEFADIGELTSSPKVRTKQGRITAQPLQTVMPEFDRLRGNRFTQRKKKSAPKNRFIKSKR